MDTTHTRFSAFGSFLAVACYAASLVLAIFSWGILNDDDLSQSLAKMEQKLLSQQQETQKLQTALDATKSLAKYQLAQTEARIEAMRTAVTSGYVASREVEVTETDRGYWLVEPKLMIGVQNLSGGALLVNFADRFETFRIGERKDLAVGGCDCYLILTESKRGRAKFYFGCSERETPDVVAGLETN